jgi:protein involved in polysaccharide export with SLBB domain
MCGIGLTVLSICVAGCQSPQYEDPEVLQDSAFRAATGNDPIKSGDVLAIYVGARGQTPEALTCVVDASGKIDVPPMGVWAVAGKTPRELKREFEQRFAKPRPLHFNVKKLSPQSAESPKPGEQIPK